MTAPTPVEDGLFMPAEWHRHGACWMAWPCRIETWRERLLPARVAFAEVARVLARFEPVFLVARPQDADQAALACGADVTVVPLALDDSWSRDFGPTFVTDGRGGVAGVAWGFNAWGNLFPDYAADAAVATGLLERLSMRCYAAPLVLEGGSVHVDGEGTLLTTEQCLLNPNRNPLMSRAEIEASLTAYLGVRRIIWLGQGLEDDETDGHVDNIACFARPGVVAMHAPADDSSDENARIMADNRARLSAARDAHGRALQIVDLPQPARRDHAGARLPLSYVNFYIANGAVLMPVFDDAADRQAHGVLARLFPDREVVALPGLEIALGGGNVHCITQQQPAGAALV